MLAFYSRFTGHEVNTCYNLAVNWLNHIPEHFLKAVTKLQSTTIVLAQMCGIDRGTMTLLPAKLPARARSWMKTVKTEAEQATKCPDRATTRPKFLIVDVIEHP